MPRQPSSEPLQKVTLDLYAKDVAEMKRLHGHYGVATVVRELVRNHIKKVHQEIVDDA